MRKNDNLSHGQRQLVELAMIMGPKPTLMLLDEPAAGLSKTESTHLARTIRELSSDSAIIVVEHDMEFIKMRMGIGYVPQGRQIFPNLTTHENLTVAQLGTQKNARSIEEVLECLPRLKPICDRAGGVLSGGEQQILALGRALISRPKLLLLLDEPTEGIQPSIRDEIVEVLLELKKKDSFAMILVEQNIEFLSALTDKLVVLQKGQIMKDLTGMEIDESLNAAFASS